jgi:hypothetical protein
MKWDFHQDGLGDLHWPQAGRILHGVRIQSEKTRFWVASHPNVAFAPDTARATESRGSRRCAQPPANDDVSKGVDAVGLEPVVGESQTDGGILHGGRLLSLWRSQLTAVVAHRCRERGWSTSSRLSGDGPGECRITAIQGIK